MTADAHQMAVPLFRGQRHTEQPLHSIHMEQRFRTAPHKLPPHFDDRQQGADLVVDQHHAGQNGIVPQRGGKILGGHMAACIRLKVRDRKSFVLQAFECIAGRRMLNGRRNDMLAQMAVFKGRAKDGGIDRLGAARSEGDLIRLGV